MKAVSSYALHQQISKAIRGEIIGGKFQIGDRLPPMESMAKDWGTSYFTIRRALAPLVREGLLESHGKRGTIVIGSQPTLTDVGLYYGADVWSIAEAAVYRNIHQELSQLIGKTDLRLKLLIDSRPPGQHGLPQEDLVQMVEERAIQGLIIPIADEAEMAWIERLQIPKSYFGTAAVSWRVRLDIESGLRSALMQLREKGARHVGLIAGMPSRYKAPHPVALFYDCFVNQLKDLGMETQNHWCAIPSYIVEARDSERFGYEAFDRIWESDPRQRPDGLICASDTIGRGVLSAVLEKQVAVPERLKLVQYVNKHSGFFTPLKVDRIVWDERAVAEALLSQLQDQLRGGTPKEIVIQPLRS